MDPNEIKNLILKKAKEGKVVFRTVDGFMECDVNEFIKQPTDGLLYDLNRDEVTVLTFLADEKWVNDYAVAMTITALKDRIAELEGLKKAPISLGADNIRHERERQIAVEGYSPDHDDQWVHGELLQATREYIESALSVERGELVIPNKVPSLWPFEWQYWKHSNDPIRNLEKAGALIAAEIDRLKRKP